MTRGTPLRFSVRRAPKAANKCKVPRGRRRVFTLGSRRLVGFRNNFKDIRGSSRLRLLGVWPLRGVCRDVPRGEVPRAVTIEET